MPLIDRITKFLRSPQGQKARAQVQRAARDPRNKAKIQRLLAKFRGGGRGTGGHGPGGAGGHRGY
ncbi:MULTISPECIES: hypothetical protein [Actinomadura]|uniref:hypothetical protein n=1 Tax=Actinomadura TaxID=1988 RepID=UPI000425775E|nr:MULTISPECIES: hypothetical protein [Actinomadura]RSN62137.1 hypothetical protein DMH08_19805 [Actinomadura sp. WAC 06369]